MSQGIEKKWFRRTFWRSNKDSEDGIAEVNDTCVQAVLDFVNKYEIRSDHYKIVPLPYGKDAKGVYFVNLQLVYFAEEELE